MFLTGGVWWVPAFSNKDQSPLSYIVLLADFFFLFPSLRVAIVPLPENSLASPLHSQRLLSDFRNRSIVFRLISKTANGSEILASVSLEQSAHLWLSPPSLFCSLALLIKAPNPKIFRSATRSRDCFFFLWFLFFDFAPVIPLVQRPPPSFCLATGFSPSNTPLD